MNRHIICAGLALGLVASNASAQDNEELSERVLECRDIANDRARVKCYDAALDNVFGRDPEVEEGREAIFGLPESSTSSTGSELVAEITALDEDPIYRRFQFTLDNGQVWQSTSTGSLKWGFRVGQKVTIRISSLGGYRLYIEGRRGFRGVKRVR